MTVAATPLALAEEYVARPIANTPYDIATMPRDFKAGASSAGTLLGEGIAEREASKISEGVGTGLLTFADAGGRVVIAGQIVKAVYKGAVQSSIVQQTKTLLEGGVKPTVEETEIPKLQQAPRPEPPLRAPNSVAIPEKQALSNSLESGTSSSSLGGESPQLATAGAKRGGPGAAARNAPEFPPSATINRAGMAYPEVIDPRTQEPIPFPEGELKIVPKENRATWTREGKNRYAFIKEWYKREYEEPTGGWQNYDIHHIKPLEYGGTNDFNNLVPVHRGTHQDEFTRFWRNF